MSKKLYEEENIRAIAEKIREKTGGTSTYTTAEMPSGIDEVYEAGVGAGGGEPVLQSKTVTPSKSTQTVTADDGYDGLSQVVVEGDSDLIASNIRANKNIFGVTGTMGDYTNTSATSISSNTFVRATNIVSVNYSACTSIGTNAFGGCTALISASFDAIQTVGNGAFRECSNLTSISLGAGLTSIVQQAFYRCTKLTTINFAGTAAQFNAVSKGASWRVGVPTSCQVVCSDGTYPITAFGA